MRTVTLTLILLLALAGCASAPPEYVAMRVDTREPAALRCIDAEATPLMVLAWLINNDLLDASKDPWAKLFQEPPFSGPRAQVDSTEYVLFYRRLCERHLVLAPSDTPGLQRFCDLPLEVRHQYALGRWRTGLFAQGDSTAFCVDGGR